jgi:ABC-2 type transport system ATP-binding protein
MLQTGSLVGELRVRELIAMVASLYPRPLDVDEVLGLAGISEIGGRRTTRLSTGQAQRVRFAIALVSNPDLLLLDEPTAALDVEARSAFWAAMRGVAARGKTVIFATHYLEEADAYADRVVVIARGRIVADGTPTQIKARVGARTIRALLPGADLETLRALPGVIGAERHGDAVTLSSAHPEVALRALFERFADVRDVDMLATGLEEAFLTLTTGELEHDDDRWETR